MAIEMKIIKLSGIIYTYVSYKGKSVKVWSTIYKLFLKFKFLKNMFN
jgi:hypothetical protein